MRSRNQGHVDAADLQLVTGGKVRPFAFPDAIANLLVQPVLALCEFRLVRGRSRAQPSK